VWLVHIEIDKKYKIHTREVQHRKYTTENTQQEENRKIL
jgi:hypothetical protein